MRHCLLLALALAGCEAGRDAGIAAVPARFELAYSEDFDDEPTDLTFTDEGAWTWNAEGTLDLTGESTYAPPFRSPHSIALIADRSFGDFILEADLMQTGREYGHRDLCLFFGYKDPSRFYYVHLASQPDEKAHNVFIVDHAARRPLMPVAARGVSWGDAAWHHVRLERIEGSVRVFFDDMRSPILELEDDTFGKGQVGFGSFDDQGRVDNVRIWTDG
jgi:hypothetical protein